MAVTGSLETGESNPRERDVVGDFPLVLVKEGTKRSGDINGKFGVERMAMMKAYMQDLNC